MLFLVSPGGLIWTLRHPGDGRLAGVLRGYWGVFATVLGMRPAGGASVASPPALRGVSATNREVLGDGFET